MQPGNVYFLALALLAIPLLPFSRSALVVGAVWLLGQGAHMVGAYSAPYEMVLSIVAVGAGLGIAANDRDRAVALSYVATAGVQISLAFGNTDPFSAWWLDWAWAMARILFLPFTINFDEVRQVYQAFKTRREWNEQIWRRVMCW